MKGCWKKVEADVFAKWTVPPLSDAVIGYNSPWPLVALNHQFDLLFINTDITEATVLMLSRYASLQYVCYYVRKPVTQLCDVR
jgi:hypothetical protein